MLLGLLGRQQLQAQAGPQTRLQTPRVQVVVMRLRVPIQMWFLTPQ